MDSARFITRKSTFAAWIIIPVALIGLTYAGTRSFIERKKTTFAQYRTLEQIIPKMVQESIIFDEFIKPYETGMSTEDSNIELINDAAESAEFDITSINIREESLDKTLGTARINMHIEGIGTARNLAMFLKNIKERDRLIYENEILISHAGFGETRLQMEAVLSKVYIRH